MTALLRSLLCLIVVAIVLVGVQLVKARAAANTADLALFRLAGVEKQIETIEQLRCQTPDWANRSRPDFGKGGLAAAVTDVLAAAGVPVSALSSVSPAAESPVSRGGANPRAGADMAGSRRRAVLTLSPITLPQIGKVIDSWQQAHPDWTIASIDLAPEPAGRKDPAPAGGTDLPLRAVIAIETLHLATQASTASKGSPQ